MSIKSQRKKEKREARKAQEKEIVSKIVDVLNQNNFIDFYYNHKKINEKKIALELLNKNNINFSFCSKELEEAIFYIGNSIFPEDFFNHDYVDNYDGWEEACIDPSILDQSE